MDRQRRQPAHRPSAASAASPACLACTALLFPSLSIIHPLEMQVAPPYGKKEKSSLALIKLTTGVNLLINGIENIIATLKKVPNAIRKENNSAHMT